MDSSGLLFAQGLLKVCLSVSHELLIPTRIDKHVGTVMRVAFQFREHVEIPTMSSQKDVAGQGTQLRKGMLEVLNDAGVAYGMAGCGDKVVLRPEARPSNDDDIPHRLCWLSWKVRAHRPGGTSARMAGGLVGSQCHSPKTYSVSVLENAVHLHSSVSGNVR